MWEPPSGCHLSVRTTRICSDIQQTKHCVRQLNTVWMTSNIISYSCGYFAMSSLSTFCLFSFLWANPFQSNCSILNDGEHARDGAQQKMLGLKEKKKEKLRSWNYSRLCLGFSRKGLSLSTFIERNHSYLKEFWHANVLTC